MDFDKILPDVGEFGRYQKLVLWFVILPGVFPCGFHAYNQLFMAAQPNHWCKTTAGFEQEPADNYENSSLNLPKIKEKCNVFNQSHEHNFTAKNLVACTNGWEYDLSEFKSTVVTEWDLVCDKNFLPTLALVLLGVGGLIGNYIFGYVQDGLGRRPAFFIYLFIQCFFGIATAFAQGFITWTIFRLGVGFTVPAILGTPYVLGIELVGPRHRTVVTILINIAYSLALVLLALIVWTVREWRMLALVTTVPFLGLFPLWWVMPESPRWLLAQGRFEELEEILLKIAKVNGKKLSANYMAQLRLKTEAIAKTTNCSRPSADTNRTYGVLDLFRNANLRIKTLIITFIWFTNTSVYVGLSYYAPILGGDVYLNFFLAGAVELPTYLFLWPSMERWGRRWTLCVSMVVGGTACLATFLVQNDSLVTLLLYCVGKMGISSSFVVLPLMASELYPTVVRGLGMSFSSVIGMLGPVFIPLINYLGADVLILPLIIMGALLVLGGICALILPETLHRHLPQNLEDGENASLDCLVCCTPPTASTITGQSQMEVFL